MDIHQSPGDISNAPTRRPGAPVHFNFIERSFTNSFLTVLVDSLALALSLYIADAILEFRTGIPLRIDRGFAIIPLWVAGAYLLKLIPGWGFSATELLRRKMILLTAVYATVIASVFILQSRGVARTTVFGAYLVSLILLPLFRMIMRAWLIRLGTWGLPAVVYGTHSTARLAIQAMKNEPGLGFYPVGVFDDDSPVGESIEGIPVIGRMTESSREAPVAVLAAPTMTREQLVSTMKGSLQGYRKVIIVPDLLESPSLWVRPIDFMGVLGLETTNNLMNPFSRGLKFTYDAFLALFFLPLWLPLLLVLALLVWIEDRANPFFVQSRLGCRGHRFKMIKFRTMRPDAEALLQQKLDAHPELRDEWERNYKLKNDPRITHVGRFLRASSLDELPQLINVLRGEMSIVGPRPLPDYHMDKLSESLQSLRSRVRPGLTGLWQVSGRSDAGNEGLERWDTYYVRNWSIWLDLVILIRTLRAVLTGKGAY